MLDNPEDIEKLLESMGCQHIQLRSNRIEAMLPEKFDSDNVRSVQIKLNENLTSSVRSRGIDNIDIYSLVSYIQFDKHTEDEMNKNLYYAKKYIVDVLGYTEEIQLKVHLTVEHNQWLKEIRKNRRIRNKIKNVEPNKTINASVLDKYIMDCPPKKWIDEGISYRTLIEFQVGYDVDSERIVFPIHNKDGQLIGVKGRYIGDDKEIDEKYKYLYLYPCDKSKELFNFHRALPYIQKHKEVLIVEAAKTVMLAWSNGIKNMVAIEGDHITYLQIGLLKSLGIEVKLVFAWDKDKDDNFIKEQLKPIKNRIIYVLYDKSGIFEDKDSPFDKGVEKFNELYVKHKYLYGR